MTRSEFLKPYLMLVIQPWGKRYQMQTAEGEAQSDLYFKRFAGMNPYVWEGVCELYAEGDHWPSIDEIKLAVRQNSREEKPRQLDGPPIPDDYPPRLIHEYSKQHDISLREAALKLLPVWLRDNPEHPERERVEALLSVMKERPKPPRLSMPTLDEHERHEFVTNAKAEGIRRACRQCAEEQELFVCWCQDWEGCKVCYVKHETACEGVESVFSGQKKRRK